MESAVDPPAATPVNPAADPLIAPIPVKHVALSGSVQSASNAALLASALSRMGSVVSTGIIVRLGIIAICMRDKESAVQIQSVLLL